jgi:hypothetical protein
MLRKVLIGALIICAGTASDGICSDNKTMDPVNKVSMLNGSAWKAFSQKEKEAYVNGLQDLVSSCYTIGSFMENTGADEETLDFISSISNMIPETPKQDKVISAINEVYASEENQKLPIVSVYLITMAEYNEWMGAKDRQEKIGQIMDYFDGKKTAATEDKTEGEE